MTGRRIYPEESDGLITGTVEPGDYFRSQKGYWFAKTPNGHLGNLSAHDIEEHADGTITVSPSIQVSMNDKELWHGHLKSGVWSEC